jgi:hypothetical protein
MKESKFPWRNHHHRAQSLTEFALMLPILLILLSGLFEFGFLFNHYLAVLDAARNASRFSSDNWFQEDDSISDCTATKDFYRQAACLAVLELATQHPTIRLCIKGHPVTAECPGTWDAQDDVIVSVFSVLRNNGFAVDAVLTRFNDEACPELGWSYAADLEGRAQCAPRTGLHASHFSTADIKAKLIDGAPNTGFVLVEINNNYTPVLGLPWFTDIIGDPEKKIKLYIYALWPLVSAEPTSTPKT